MKIYIDPDYNRDNAKHNITITEILTRFSTAFNLIWMRKKDPLIVHFRIWDVITVIAFQMGWGAFDADSSRLCRDTCPKSDSTLCNSTVLPNNIVLDFKFLSISPMVFTSQIHGVLYDISFGRRHHSQVSLQYIIESKGGRYAKHPETRRNRALDATTWGCLKSN